MPDLPASIADNDRYASCKAQRESDAADARKAKRRHRSSIVGFILATACAAVLGGLALHALDAPPTADTAPNASWIRALVSAPHVRLGLGIAQALSIAAAAWCAHLLIAGKYGEEWLKHRDLAEEGRRQLARIALELGHADGPDTFAAAARHLKEDLIKGQISYLEASAQTHAKGAHGLVLIGATLVTGAALVGALASMNAWPLIAAIGALFGVVSPALLAGVKSWDEASRSAERAALDKATLRALRLLVGESKALDDAVASHDLVAALRYAERVFEVLRRDQARFQTIMGAAVQTKGA
jgi:hypothetical protein